VSDYRPEEKAAIEADRRRRATAAFRLGSGAIGSTGSTSGLPWLAPLLVGAGIGVGIALIAGIVTLAQHGAR
jgi:hypothetical protein